MKTSIAVGVEEAEVEGVHRLYEAFTRLAETRLAQNALTYIYTASGRVDINQTYQTVAEEAEVEGVL